MEMPEMLQGDSLKRLLQGAAVGAVVNVVDRDNLLVALIASAPPAMPHGDIRKAST